MRDDAGGLDIPDERVVSRLMSGRRVLDSFVFKILSRVFDKFRSYSRFHIFGYPEQKQIFNILSIMV
jgi:hypothetical protein